MKLFLKIVLVFVIWQGLTGRIVGQISSTSRKSFNLHANQSIFNCSNLKQNVQPLKPIRMFKKLLRMARDILQLKTLVLFNDFKYESRIFENFIRLKQDKVIISQPLKWELREFFSSNILSIVFMNSPYLNHKLLNIFKQSTHRWHLKKVLVITESNLLKPNSLWLDLFNWLHDQGFWNSFLLDTHGNTLAMDHFDLKLLPNLLTLEDFFHLTMKWTDLKGYPIHVSMANDPPRALIVHTKNNQIKFAGYFGTIMTIFSKFFNASMVTHQISDLDFYHELDCLKFIESNEVDVCGDGMALLPYSYHVIAYPMQIYPSNLVVPYGQPLPRFYYFLKPFQWPLWCLVFSTFLFNILALSFIHHMQKGSWLLTFQLEYAVLDLANLPLQLKRVKGPLRTYLELLLFVKGFVISNLYLSLLTSLLYTSLYYKDINSMEDLQRFNISIMVNDFEYFLLMSTDLDPIVTQQLMLVPDETLLKHRRNLDPDYAYYSQMDKNYFYLYQQKFLLRPRMKELSKIPVQTLMGSMPIRFNWPFEDLLNNLLKNLRDAGLFRRYLEQSPEDGIRSGYLKFFPTEHHYVKPLSWEYFKLPGVILAGGCMLGFVIFLMENLYFKKFEKK